MDFKEKIDKVLSIRKIKLWKLAEISGLGNTLEKAYEENREMRKAGTDQLLQKLGINTEWWNTQEGELFDKNITNAEETSDNKENRGIGAELVDLIQSNDRYSLIPNIILNHYKIMPESEFAHNQKKWQDIVDAKNDLIRELEDHVKELQAAASARPAKQTQQQS
jgi:hypothetical protein